LGFVKGCETADRKGHCVANRKGCETADKKGCETADRKGCETANRKGRLFNIHLIYNASFNGFLNNFFAIFQYKIIDLNRLRYVALVVF
jgi:hypothetical protein